MVRGVLPIISFSVFVNGNFDKILGMWVCVRAVLSCLSSNWVFSSAKVVKNIRPWLSLRYVRILVMNFDKVGSNGLGAFGSCPIPDVNFLFFFFFFLTGPKGDNDGC